MQILYNLVKKFSNFYIDYQGRSQDFVIGGLNRSWGGASLKNFKILKIRLRHFYVMVK